MIENEPGQIVWHDLTVPNAEQVKNFYSEVVGWQVKPVSMGDYDDFTMCAHAGEEPIAGVCHAQGANADIPPVWMMYVQVVDIDQSIQAVVEQGGKVLKGPTSYQNQRYYLIQDPAGAVMTIYG